MHSRMLVVTPTGHDTFMEAARTCPGRLTCSRPEAGRGFKSRGPATGHLPDLSYTWSPVGPSPRPAGGPIPFRPPRIDSPTPHIVARTNYRLYDCLARALPGSAREYLVLDRRSCQVEPSMASGSG